AQLSWPSSVVPRIVRIDEQSLITVIFFVQAEDGIRDFHVTGVQTCALPISTELTEESPTERSAEWGSTPKGEGARAKRDSERGDTWQSPGTRYQVLSTRYLHACSYPRNYPQPVENHTGVSRFRGPGRLR